MNSATDSNEKKFKDMITLRQETYDEVKKLLEETTVSCFDKIGYKRVEGYQGEYGTGDKYGHGAQEGRYDIKLVGKTKSFIEKEILFGAKKTRSYVDMTLNPDGMFGVRYTTTETTMGRTNSDGPLMISANITVDANEKGYEKKLKDFFYKAAEQEVYYITETKLGIQDKIETHSDTVNESFSFKKLFFGSLDETETMMDNFISEAKKKKEEILVDDKEEVSEVTTAGAMGAPGTAGDFQYDTAKAFKKNLKLKKEGMQRPLLEKTMGSDGFWTKVDLAPLQMTHVMGMPGVKPNSKEELERSMGSLKKGSFKESKSLDLTKKKFIDEEEQKALGINKRYIITKQLSENEEFDKWKRLTNFKSKQSILEAEECGGEDPIDHVITGDEYNALLSTEFERNNGESEDDTQFSVPEDSEDVVVVSKPDSFINYKFLKNDFLNENKYYIVDMVTGNYVVNPNHTTQKK